MMCLSGFVLPPPAMSCHLLLALLLFRYGFIYESFFMRVLVCWIAMQGLIVINFLPARVMMYGIPLGGLVLLSIVGEFTMQNTMSNLGGSITSAISCSRCVRAYGCCASTVLLC